ncbi:TPA: DNA gyrase subunit A [Clostridium perfringens]
MKAIELHDLLNKNCMDYAEYVILERAIPDVRDGNKNIHRRILWSMNLDGLQHNKNRTKSINASGSVLRFSPHGDSSVYQAMVRLTNDSVNYPLIDGKGSFGSITSKEIQPGAARYCVVGDSLVSTPQGLIKIKDIVENSKDNSDNNISINVHSIDNKTQHASKFFNCGKHPTYNITTQYNYSITGTENHPLLTLDYNDEENNLLYKWKTIDEIQEGDVIVFDGDKNYNEVNNKISKTEAMFLGGMVSEGYISGDQAKYNRVGFLNTNFDFVEDMYNCFREIFPKSNVTHNISKTINKISKEIYCHDYNSRNKMIDYYEFKYGSKNKEIPSLILKSDKERQAIFLKYLYEGDGSVYVNQKNNGSNGRISYSTSSYKLAYQLQILLLNSFGILSGLSRDREDYRIDICNKNSIITFYNKIGFAYKEKQNKLKKLCDYKDKPDNKFASPRIGEGIPSFITTYIRKSIVKNKTKIDRLKGFCNINKIKKHSELLKNSLPSDKYKIIQQLIDSKYFYLKVTNKTFKGEQNVYSIRVDNECHSFIANGMINHNTEMRLAPISQEYLTNINKDAVNMQDNYDNTRLEPEVLPVSFPAILCQPNIGIAVGIASNICPFPLTDVIDNTIHAIKGEELKVMIPDFTTGGYIVYDEAALKKVHNTGQGGIKIRCKYHIENNSIVITEIPYTTTRESIINSIITLVKDGKIKDIVDVNDYSGKKGLNITIDVKKNVNIDSLMKKLYKLTPLEDSFSCNFTVINHDKPMVLGVPQILKEWVKFREDTVKRILSYDLTQKKEKYHLLLGLEKILADVDKAIDIIKKSDDNNIIVSLQDYFNIDSIQAEYIANMKLRNINTTNITKQLMAIKTLKTEINDLINKINSKDEINKIIINDLERVKKNYGRERISGITYDLFDYNDKDLIEEYNCRIVYTKNYIKKHLKQSDNHKVKEGEIIINDIATNNKSTLLVFTNKANRYKIPVYELEDLTPSAYGQFIPSLIQLEEGEEVIRIVSVDDSSKGYIVSVFENGKVAKVNIKSFMSNNKKLMNCFNTEGKLISIDYIEKDKDVFILSSEGKGLVFSTERINSKSSRNTQGNIGIKLNEGFKVVAAIIDVTKDDRFTIHTEKGKEIRVLLDDVSPKDDTMWFDYVYGKCGNMGNFIYNTRSKNDLITNVEVD